MVRFAVVGLGMGRNRAQLITETAGAELACVVDLNADLARASGADFGCDWVTDLDDALGRTDVDVVMVMTPSGLHADLGVRCVEAGKHVITTKPMDVSTAACDRLIAAADAAGVVLGVDYQSRYIDTNVRVATALHEGLLGRPLLGEVRFKWFRSDDYFAHGGGWRGTWQMDGGGSLANQGSHLIDLLLWFMGDPDRVYGEASVVNHDIETEDVGMAILRYPNGARGAIVGTTTFPTNAYFSAEVHGTEGGVLIDAALTGEARYFGAGVEQKLAAIDNPLQNVIEDVVSCLQEGTQLRVDGREGRRTVALLEAIYESSRQSMPLAFESRPMRALQREPSVALVGVTGPHSRGWLATLQSLTELGTLVLCDVDGDDAGAAGAHASQIHPTTQLPEEATVVAFESLLAGAGRPDMALLSVRNDQAPGLGAQLLAAGIPCIIEKPCGRTSLDIERLNAAATAGDTIWAPGFLNRLQPAARRIHRLVREGALGQIRSIEARMVTSSVAQRNPEHWLFDKQLAGGGILHWLAIHTVDLIRYLTGQEFSEVSGHTRTFTGGIDVEDMAALSFALSAGGVGNLHAGYILRQRYGDIGMTLRGDLGEIVWPQWDVEGQQHTLHVHSEGPQIEGSLAEAVTMEPPAGVGYGGGLGQQFVRSFVHAAQMGGRFITNGDDALQAMRFVEAAYHASDSGMRVTL